MKTLNHMFIHPARRTARHCRRGFTLIEMMVAVVIGAMIMGAACNTYIMLLKSSLSVSNYIEMASNSRLALEYFGRDMKMASAVYTATVDNLIVGVPSGQELAGFATLNFVQYQFLPETDPKRLGKFKLVCTGYNDKNVKNFEKVLMHNVLPGGYQFLYFTHDGDVATTAISIKDVQMSVKLESKTIALKQTDYVLSARFMMRNKPTNL